VVTIRFARSISDRLADITFSYEVERTMNSKKNWLFNGAVVIGCSLAMLTLTACQQGEADFSANRRAQAVTQLRAASELDYSKADAPNVDPVSKEDLYAQAKTAESDANVLQNGGDVTREDIDAALVVPNEPRSPEAIARLIERLDEARTMDNIGDRDNSVEPVYAQDFDVQSLKASQVLADLKAGEGVPRVLINDALEVPPNP
jgi:hypothetical protein